MKVITIHQAERELRKFPTEIFFDTNMKTKLKTYKNVRDFGKAMGLSEMDMVLVQQKKKIIERLKKRRIKNNISQVTLAKMVGSQQPAIARMESGQVSQVSLDFLARVALALHTSFTFHNTKLAA